MLLSGDQRLDCSSVRHEKLFPGRVLVTLGRWGLWVLVPVDNYLKIRPEKNLEFPEMFFNECILCAVWLCPL